MLCLVCCLGLVACGNGGSDTQKSDASKNEDKAKTSGYVYVSKDQTIAADADFAPIAEALGEPVKYYEAASCAFEGLDKTYVYDGFTVGTYPDTDGKDRVAEICFTDDTVKTPEGASLGMTAEKIQEIYGADGKVTDTSITYEKGDMQLLFILKDGKVTSIQYLSKVLG